MEYSKYQQAVFDFISHGTGNGGVIAVAGSGKTTTSVKSLDFVPPGAQVIFSCFNKHIRTEMQSRVPNGVACSTYNAFGWGILRQHSKRVQLDEFKTWNILKYDFFDFGNADSRKEYKLQAPVVSRLVSLIKALNIHTSDEVQARLPGIIDDFGIDIIDDRTEQYAHQVWQRSVEVLDYADYDDQIYMPLHLGHPVPKYDFVFIDEFQDTSLMQITLMLQAGEFGRIIAIGDPCQAIYSFRGADPEAMQSFMVQMNATQLPLSICYRCPKKVVELAQRIVPYIEASPTAPEGTVETVTTAQFKSNFQEDDFVLCRTTAPLVRRCLEAIRAGRRCTVRGRDIGRGLTELIERVEFHESEPTDQFWPRMQEYRMAKCEEFDRFDQESRKQSLNDQVDTIGVMAANYKTVGELKAAIESLFTDNKGNFMTVHKSKGLQNPRVWILRPDLIPHPKSKGKPRQEAEEDRLYYVAVTRSQNELFWVEPERDER